MGSQSDGGGLGPSKATSLTRLALARGDSTSRGWSSWGCRAAVHTAALVVAFPLTKEHTSAPGTHVTSVSRRVPRSLGLPEPLSKETWQKLYLFS